MPDVSVSVDLTQVVNDNFRFILFVGLPFALVVVVAIISLLFWSLLLILKTLDLKIAFGKFEIGANAPISPITEIKRSYVVYSELALICQALSADLVCIFQLHNGGKYNNGNSVLKFTQSHYYANKGRRNFYNSVNKFQNRLISMSPDWIAPTIEKGHSYINVRDMNPESEWRREFERNNIESYVQVCIKTDGVEEMVVSAFFGRSIYGEEAESFIGILCYHASIISVVLKDEEVMDGYRCKTNN